jgi:hypothetical protein
MTLEEIQKMPIIEFLDLWKYHRKIVCKCRFFGVRRSEWTDSHVRELNHLLDKGKKGYCRELQDKKEYHFLVNGEIMSYSEFFKNNKNLSLGNVLNHIRRKGFYLSKCKTLKIEKA